MSRFVFLGFGIVFCLTLFSFMKPFLSYELGAHYQRHKLLSRCILFFHIGTTSLLVAKVADEAARKDILINSILLIFILSIAIGLLKVCYRQEVLILWYIVFFLVDVGYIMLERLNHPLATKQVIWVGIGVTGALIVPYVFKWLIYPKYKSFYMFLTLGIISLPFLFGASKNGALNWVQIGPISFQPSELGKVTFVMFLAAYFTNFEKNKNKGRALIIIGGIVGLILLQLVIQRDLGSALLYFITFVVMTYVGTQSAWVPLLGVIGGGLSAILGYLCFDHVKVRVEVWLDPFIDASGKGYQVVQGLFALGTWGFLGSGLTRGLPNKIPIVETDYIFAAIGEELGNGFAIVVLLSYLALVLQGLKMALIQKKDFDTLILVGLVSLLAGQTLIIVGGVLKLIPLTGITMPFVSYGGSSMVVSFGMIGMLSFLLSQALKKTKKEGDDYET